MPTVLRSLDTHVFQRRTAAQAQLGEAIVASGRVPEAVESVRAAAEEAGFAPRVTSWGEAAVWGKPRASV